MSEIKSLKIEDREYKLVVMSPWVGAEFATKVAALMTSALAGEAGEAADLAKLKDAGEGDISARILSMIMRVIPHIDPDKFSQLARRCFVESSVTAPDGTDLGEEGLFDAWFSRYRGDYFPVVIWAIKENCTGFFAQSAPAWSALGGLFLPSKSPKTD